MFDVKSSGPNTPSSRIPCLSYGQAVIIPLRVVELMYSWRGIPFGNFCCIMIYLSQCMIYIWEQRHLVASFTTGLSFMSNLQLLEYHLLTAPSMGKLR